MSNGARQTLRSKLLRITQSVMWLISFATLTAVVLTNYVTEAARLKEIEHYIRLAMVDKATTLVESHARVLKGLVSDNSFGDVRQLVGRAVNEDPDVVYGLFVGADDRLWAYEAPSGKIVPNSWSATKEIPEELKLDAKSIPSDRVRHREVQLRGEAILEWATSVVGDEREPLGVIVYGFSQQRSRRAVLEARSRSSNALLRALGTIAVVGLTSLLLGAVMVSRAATRVTDPVVKLTDAARRIGAGERGIRVDIASGDEIETLAAAFNRMLEANEEAMRRIQAAMERALESDRLKSEFLANMSHEIRTPMNGILGMTRLLMDVRLDRRARRYLETIDVSANALLTIINDILDFSKMEAGKYTLQSVPFSPIAVVQDLVGLLGGPANEKCIELTYRIGHLDRFAIGDPDRFRQILTNLVGNAVKFTDSGEVFVDVKIIPLQQDRIKIEAAVHDTGIGIAEADIPKLYEAFSQVDGSMVRRHGGTGLGLAISKRLANMMGGTIEVKSTQGVGSVFTASAEFDLGEPTSEDRTRPTWAQGRRAVVASGNRHWDDLIEEHLGVWGLSCQVVENASSILECVSAGISRGQPIDVALIGADIQSPNAGELVKSLRADERTRSLPILLLTSLRKGRISSSLKDDVTAELSKPLNLSELYDCLARLFSPVVASEFYVHSEEVPIERDKCILVVDDSDINRFVAVEELKRRGFAADMATNGAEALEKTKTGAYALVLMDCQMPIMDGYTATREIRRWEQRNGRNRVPIVALTAHALAGERSRVLQAGMDDYLSKPFRGSTLDKALRRAISDRPAASVARIARPEWLATVRPCSMEDLVDKKPGALNDHATSGRAAEEALVACKPDAQKTAARVPPSAKTADSEAGAEGSAEVPELTPGIDRSENLIRLFLSRMRVDLDGLGKAISRGGPTEVRDLAHKIKGGCLALEAEAMARVAESLQFQAEDGDISGAVAAHGQLMTRFRKVAIELERLLPDISTSTSNSR